MVWKFASDPVELLPTAVNGSSGIVAVTCVDLVELFVVVRGWGGAKRGGSGSEGQAKDFSELPDFVLSWVIDGGGL